MKFDGWPFLSLFRLGTPPPQLFYHVREEIVCRWQQDEDKGETPQYKVTSTEGKIV